MGGLFHHHPIDHLDPDAGLMGADRIVEKRKQQPVDDEAALIGALDRRLADRPREGNRCSPGFAIDRGGEYQLDQLHRLGWIEEMQRKNGPAFQVVGQVGDTEGRGIAGKRDMGWQRSVQRREGGSFYGEIFFDRLDHQCASGKGRSIPCPNDAGERGLGFVRREARLLHRAGKAGGDPIL